LSELAASLLLCYFLHLAYEIQNPQDTTLLRLAATSWNSALAKERLNAARAECIVRSSHIIIFEWGEGLPWWIAVVFRRGLLQMHFSNHGQAALAKVGKCVHRSLF
jgi:hypothetical protein